LDLSVKGSLEERCYGILEEKGGEIADKARTILLEEESLISLQRPLKYISEIWRDPFAPSMVILSCEAVGGKPDEATYQAALAMALMNLSFRLWDDIMDKTTCRGFVPTVRGDFGEGVALMVGGLVSAKAFSVLSGMKLNETKRQAVTELVWNYWGKLARAEATNLELRRRSDVKPEEKLKVFEMEGVGVETMLKVGAVLGNGSEDEVKHLGNYGRYLGTILELRKDFNVAINLTLELAEKIRSGALPYTLLWAKNRSKKIREYLPLLMGTIKPIDIREIVEAMLETKALENTMRVLEKMTKKAEAEFIELKDNKSSRMLRLFLEAQSEIFVESLCSLQF